MNTLTWGFEFPELVIDEREVEDDRTVLVSWMFEDIALFHLLTFILLHLEGKAKESDKKNLVIWAKTSVALHSTLQQALILFFYDH